MGWIELVLSAFGGASVALAIAGFLGKKFVDLQASRALEKYKAELEQKSAVLKTELSIYAHEQNIGLTRLDQQRSDAIQQIYGLVMKWHDLFLDITVPNEPPYAVPELKLRRYLNLAQNIVKVAEDISTKVRDTAIFFQQESYETIARFGSAAMNLSCAFYDSTFGKVDMSKDLNYDELFPLIEKERADLRAASRDDFNKLRELLVSEFRRLMKADREGQLTPASTPTRAEAARVGHRNR